MLEDELMTAEQCMKALGICRGTFYTRLKDGIIPKPIELGPHRKFWARATIMKFIDENKEISK